MVAAVAVVGAIRRWVELPTAILLYLVPIIFAASRWSRGPAIVAAVLSATLHNVLFVEPVGTLTIDHPADAFSLGLLLFTAVVTAQLADSARQRAQAERDATVARRSDELKTALLRTVSHELRSPLASIKAAVSGLRRPARPIPTTIEPSCWLASRKRAIASTDWWETYWTPRGWSPGP